MNKSRKIIALFIAAGTLSIGGALAAQAAGWQADGNNWYYIDNNGDRITNEWKKSGEHWFYLDSNGTMTRNSIVESGDNYYYVNEDGAMSANRWVLTDPETVGEDGSEQIYLYFGPNGRAYRKGNGNGGFLKKTINNKEYAFNENGRMLSGWVDENGEQIDESEDDPFAKSTYYFGAPNDGAMKKNSWLSYEAGSSGSSNIDNISYEDLEKMWFYFDSNGKIVRASDSEDTKEKTINGSKYIFDRSGVMLSSWIFRQSASQTAATARYFSEDLDGHLKKNSWIYAVPDENMDAEDHENDQERWFYAGSSGNLYKNTIKKINGKRYIFDANGIMRSGFVLTDNSGSYLNKFDSDEYSRSDFTKGSLAGEINGNDLYFAGTDEKKDGSIKTGKTVRIELSDGTYTFGFASNGKAYGTNGTELVSSRYYVNGLMLSGNDDYKYGIVRTADGKLVVVNSSGVKQSGNIAVKDGNDGYIMIKDGIFYAYTEADSKPVYSNGHYYMYDADANGKRGDEIETDSDGSTLPDDMKLNF